MEPMQGFLCTNHQTHLLLNISVLVYSTLSPWFLRVFLRGLHITTGFLGLLAKVSALDT